MTTATDARDRVDIGSLISIDPDVYHGLACMAGTRIPVHALALYVDEGQGAQAIASDLHLPLELVYAGLAHYFANRGQIDSEIDAEAELGERLAAESWRTHERLLANRNS